MLASNLDHQQVARVCRNHHGKEICSTERQSIAYTPRMDNTTVLFILALVVVFLFLRWLISPIPHTDEFSVDTGAARSTSTASGSTLQLGSGTATRNRRPVTESMIEIVQAIAPTLTREQIEYDLGRSGLIEQTIENYMESGGLPVPPASHGATPLAPRDDTPASVLTRSELKSAKQPSKDINLIDRFDVDVTATAESISSDASGASLKSRKQKMILEARNRLKLQLENHVDMPIK